jgi:hypothetical protein
VRSFRPCSFRDRASERDSAVFNRKPPGRPRSKQVTAAMRKFNRTLELVVDWYVEGARAFEDGLPEDAPVRHPKRHRCCRVDFEDRDELYRQGWRDARDEAAEAASRRERREQWQETKGAA